MPIIISEMREQLHMLEGVVTTFCHNHVKKLISLYRRLKYFIFSLLSIYYINTGE